MICGRYYFPIFSDQYCDLNCCYFKSPGYINNVYHKSLYNGWMNNNFFNIKTIWKHLVGHCWLKNAVQSCNDHKLLVKGTSDNTFIWLMSGGFYIFAASVYTCFRDWSWFRAFNMMNLKDWCEKSETETFDYWSLSASSLVNRTTVQSTPLLWETYDLHGQSSLAEVCSLLVPF